MHEIPLVLFTLCGQTAAGMLVLLAIQHAFHPVSDVYLKRTTAVAWIILFVGLFFAMFHLGHPFRAWNVIFGMMHSPMSQEIFCFGLLFALTFLYVLLNFYEKGTARQMKLFLMLLGVISLIFVYSIIRVYYLNTVETWAIALTPLQMYASVLILGGAALGALGLAQMGLIGLALGVMITLGIKPGYQNFLSTHSLALTAEQVPWWTIQTLCLIAALCAFFMATTRKTSMPKLPIIGLVLAVFGELCGRIAFYNVWMIPM